MGWYAFWRECSRESRQHNAGTGKRGHADEGTQIHAAQIVSCGQLACLALKRSGGVAIPVGGFEDAPYAEASGEILWVGAQLPAMHPRAVVTSHAVPRGIKLRFEVVPDHGWSQQLPLVDDLSIPQLVDEVERLHRSILCVAPKGFGVWLAGHPLPFPLALAASHLHSLSQAYSKDDPAAVLDASAGLLGFGTGLTPSGDDLIGAALFGRQLVAPGEARWKAAGERLGDLCADRSHRLSTALFRDLVRGQSFEPLHDLAQALAAGLEAQAMTAARKLVTIGHSSGWDMLTGFVLGVTGPSSTRLPVS